MSAFTHGQTIICRRKQKQLAMYNMGTILYLSATRTANPGGNIMIGHPYPGVSECNHP